MRSATVVFDVSEKILMQKEHISIHHRSDSFFYSAPSRYGQHQAETTIIEIKRKRKKT